MMSEKQFDQDIKKSIEDGSFDEAFPEMKELTEDKTFAERLRKERHVWLWCLLNTATDLGVDNKDIVKIMRAIEEKIPRKTILDTAWREWTGNRSKAKSGI